MTFYNNYGEPINLDLSEADWKESDYSEYDFEDRIDTDFEF